MRVRLGTVLVFAILLVVLAATAVAAPIRVTEFEGHSAAFRLDGSNGYSIAVSAFSDRADGKGDVSVFVTKKGESAIYTVPAIITEAALHADLGALGRIDAVRRGSGREKSVRLKCGGPRVIYEPAVWEGALEFEGEGGYTHARQASASESPNPFLGFPCGGGGRGESLNSDRLPGARLKGTSYARGRVLKFQVNKNRPGGPAFFTASVRERHGGMRIYRTLTGRSPARAFSFPHSLRTATLAPPAPFSGRASLSRGGNSVLPIWEGDLTVDFLGAPRVPLASPGVYVTLVHARFTRGGDGTVGVSFRSR